MRLPWFYFEVWAFLPNFVVNWTICIFLLRCIFVGSFSFNTNHEVQEVIIHFYGNVDCIISNWRAGSVFSIKKG